MPGFRRPLASLALALAALLPMLPASAPAGQVVGSGWRVDWPLQAERQRVAPGTLLRVGVAPAKAARAGGTATGRARRAQARATVTLTRLAGGGRAARVLVRTRLRRGVVRVRIPRGAGPRYVLAVRGARGTIARGVLRTAPIPAAPVPAPPKPTRPATLPPAVGCTSDVTRRAATMTADRTSAVAGETLTLTIANTGGTCLTVGYPYGWERQTPAGWEPVRTGEIFILPAIGILPGRSWSSAATVADATKMPPGRYRVVKHADPAAPGDAVGPLQLTAEIDVLPGFGDGSSPAWCAGATRAPAAATLTLDRDSVRNGEQLVATIANTGGWCLRGYRGAELFDAEQPHAPVALTPAPDLRHDYQLGGTFAFPFAVPSAAEMPVGRYRLRAFLTVARNSDAVETVVVQDDFEVVAPE